MYREKTCNWLCIHVYITGGDSHEGYRQLGLWVIAGMLSFLIIEKMFAKEDEYEHVSFNCLKHDNRCVCPVLPDGIEMLKPFSKNLTLPD